MAVGEAGVGVVSHHHNISIQSRHLHLSPSHNTALTLATASLGYQAHLFITYSGCSLVSI